MIEAQALTETALARESLKRMGLEKSPLTRAAIVLELVAHSSVGLGEVLQDYAHQTCGQLMNFIRAAANVTHGTTQPGDIDALANIHFILKSVKAVLEMTPTAMQRNKAEALGEKDRLTRADIGEITHEFLHSPDVTRLLAAEDSGQVFAGLAETAGAPVAGHVPERALAAASH